MDIAFGVVVHGGAGTPETLSDGCTEACRVAFDILGAGGQALEAVVEACRIMEDDGRFNAGSGSVLRLDGKTVEMDAGVMDSAGKLGMVMNMRGFRNPVKAARAVAETPHVAFAGRGAETLAAKRGIPPFPGVSAAAVERHEKICALLKEGRLGELNPLWGDIDSSFFEGLSCDTVGAVAVDQRGVFAAAASTGGATPMLVGRVGDTPMIGCGFYAGPAGAFAATGIGEEIIRRMLAKEVYDRLARGDDLLSACRGGTGLFPENIPVGLIGISPGGYAASANRPMAHHAMVREH